MDARPVADRSEVLHLESLFSRDGHRALWQSCSQLKTLGLEGGIDRKLELKSLEPLGALFEPFTISFLAAARVATEPRPAAWIEEAETS